MGKCTGAETGAFLRQTFLLWSTCTTCVNLSDPVTMAELKTVLSGLTNVVTTPGAQWTRDDENAFQIWAYEQPEPEEMIQRMANGWLIPTGNAIANMLERWGYPTESNVAHAFPRLTSFYDKYRPHELASRVTSPTCTSNVAEVEPPPVGSQVHYPTEPEPAPAPEPEPAPADTPLPVFPTPSPSADEAAISTISPTSVALAVAAVGALVAAVIYTRKR